MPALSAASIPVSVGLTISLRPSISISISVMIHISFQADTGPVPHGRQTHHKNGSDTPQLAMQPPHQTHKWCDLPCFWPYGARFQGHSGWHDLSQYPSPVDITNRYPRGRANTGHRILPCKIWQYVAKT